MEKMTEKTYVVQSAEGIHARPATKLVHAAGQCEGEVSLTYNERTVNLKSVLGIMSLGVPSNASFTIRVEGGDEAASFQILEETMKEEGIIA